jgi:ribosome maturation factor RimP
MTVAERVRELVEPLLADRDLAVYDVEMAGPVLRVVVDAEGALDLDALSDASRAVSRALDDADLIAGRYTLEVTSPGLERTLRTPKHFARAVGERIKVKTVPSAAPDAERRVTGELAAADDDGITVRTGSDDAGEPALRRLPYSDIERARTVFEWGPAERPGGRKSNEKRDHRS